MHCCTQNIFGNDSIQNYRIYSLGSNFSFWRRGLLTIETINWKSFLPCKWSIPIPFNHLPRFISSWAIEFNILIAVCYASSKQMNGHVLYWNIMIKLHIFCGGSRCHLYKLLDPMLFWKRTAMTDKTTYLGYSRDYIELWPICMKSSFLSKTIIFLLIAYLMRLR